MSKLRVLTGLFLFILGMINSNGLAAQTDRIPHKYNKSDTIVAFPKDGPTPTRQGSIALRGGPAADHLDEPAFTEACSLDPEQINWVFGPPPDIEPFESWFTSKSTLAGNGGWTVYPPTDPTFNVLWVEQQAGEEPLTLEVAIAPLKFLAFCTFQFPETGSFPFEPGSVQFIHVYDSEKECGDDPLPCESPGVIWKGHGYHLIVRSSVPNHGYKIRMTPPSVGRFGMFIGMRIYGTPQM